MVGISSGITSSSNNSITPKKLITVAPVAASNKQVSPTPMRTTSFVGDFLRGVTNAATDGHFGNGNAAQQAGESSSDYTNRLLQAGGTAVEAFNNNVTRPSNAQSASEAFKGGVTQQAVSNALNTYVPIVLIGGLGIWGLSKLFKKGSKRRY